ncbi:MAG: hypothetical protein JST86_13000 [Bacteroidetes bacterium]|nr:hypothetical protein [Bacteroidota bacterium]
MKKLIIVSMGLLLSSSLLFTACKKTSTSSSGTTEIANESQVQSDDQSAEANATDEFTTDASTVSENVIAVTGNGPQTFFAPPCNATITYDTLNAVRTITITYNGLNCVGNIYRTGTLTISIPAGQQWKNAGAQLTITATNLKYTRVSNNKSITINGSEVITNVTGGLLRNLATVGTITHTIASSGINITFDDGSQRSWQIAKQRVFTYSNGIVISTTGTHTEGTLTGVSEWGSNRFGNAFVTQIIDPMVIRQDCNFRLTSGHVKHSKLLRTVDVTFGLDAQGNPTSCPGTGNYYMKIVWVNALGVSVTAILPY